MHANKLKLKYVTKVIQCLSPEATCICFDIFPELFRILLFLRKITPKNCIYIIQFRIYKYI